MMLLSGSHDILNE